jgi:hypothetical protein
MGIDKTEGRTRIVEEQCSIPIDVTFVSRIQNEAPRHVEGLPTAGTELGFVT